MSDPWARQMESLGSYIRSQRLLANLSLRQLADLASVSNPYLSQIERGLHEPSMRVLKSIAEALGVSAETLLTRAGMLSKETVAGGAAEADGNPVEAAIQADRALTDEGKAMLVSLYRTLVRGAPAD